MDTWRQALRQATEVQDPEGNTATVELARLFDADGLALRPFLCPYDGDEPAGPFQGHPFGEVYHGLTPGGPMDPNFDEDEDGLPELLSTGEPSLEARCPPAPKKPTVKGAGPVRIGNASTSSWCAERQQARTGRAYNLPRASLILGLRLV